MRLSSIPSQRKKCVTGSRFSWQGTQGEGESYEMDGKFQETADAISSQCEPATQLYLKMVTWHENGGPGSCCANLTHPRIYGILCSITLFRAGTDVRGCAGLFYSHTCQERASSQSGHQGGFQVRSIHVVPLGPTGLRLGWCPCQLHMRDMHRQRIVSFDSPVFFCRHLQSSNSWQSAG